ncbi:hypothetical protein WAK64_15800 [Bacillus spongiae]|uniref:DUF2004 domain-containing protein n=1 Tax=Bacillus spongiae TaxID=2683610 RepID=A0ABU8HGK5_9BACI
MKESPKYAKTIIVFVKYKNEDRWYVADKELWFLDLRKLSAAFSKIVFDDDLSNDFSDRYDIDIVNEDTAEDFLNHIREASTEELHNILKGGFYSDIVDLVPSLYIDFDNKIFLSYYPEPASYEVFVPNGWVGKYEDFMFTDSIPPEYRYWIINGKDVFL